MAGFLPHKKKKLFRRINEERLDLIDKKYGDGLTEDEKRRLIRCTKVVDLLLNRTDLVRSQRQWVSSFEKRLGLCTSEVRKLESKGARDE